MNKMMDNIKQMFEQVKSLVTPTVKDQAKEIAALADQATKEAAKVAKKLAKEAKQAVKEAKKQAQLEKKAAKAALAAKIKQEEDLLLEQCK